MEILSTSTKKTQKLACAIAQKIRPGMVLALFGDLGSGKTTFTGFLVKALGFDSRVQSPTFVIHRLYSTHSVGSGKVPQKQLAREFSRKPSASRESVDIIHHVDLYRLTSKDEVLDIGLDEMLQEPHSLVLIEWPELAMDLLPKDTIKLYFTTVDDNTRRIIVEGLD